MAEQHVPPWRAAMPSAPQQPSGQLGEGRDTEAIQQGQTGYTGQYAQPAHLGQPVQYAQPYPGIPVPQVQPGQVPGVYSQLPYAQSEIAASEPQASPGPGITAFTLGCLGLLLLLFLPWLATVIIGMVLCLVALGLGASSMRKAGLIGRFSILAFWLGVIGMLIGTITIIVMITLS